MARARNIKPAFFKNEVLAELPFEHRLLFIGLWTLADREGRLEDRPKRIKMELFPADRVDVEKGLLLLEQHGFIKRYSVNGFDVLQVIAFTKHQSPHHTEKHSELPDINGEITVKERKQDGGNPPDSLIPDSLKLIPDSLKPEKGASAPRFIKPSLDSIVAEFTGRCADPVRQAETFHAYYESNGWKIGKNPMKSWKATVTTWVKRGSNEAHQRPVRQTRSEINQQAHRDYIARLEREEAEAASGHLAGFIESQAGQ